MIHPHLSFYVVYEPDVGYFVSGSWDDVLQPRDAFMFLSRKAAQRCAAERPNAEVIRYYCSSVPWRDV